MIETARAELPAEPKLQRRFAEYIEWGVGIAREASQPGYAVPPAGPAPRWGWGPDGPPGEARPPADGAAATAGRPSFAADVQPLFREGDRASMRWAFDLWSYEDVKRHADAVLERLSQGTMPCDGAWPPERVAVFRRWVDAGGPA